MSSIYFSLIFIILYYCPFSMGEVLEKMPDNYGPFLVKWNNYGPCKAPKAVNLTTYSTSLLVENSTYKGIMNFTYLSSVVLDEVKIMVYSVKAGRKSLLWNYRVDKPCQHYAITEIMRSNFGLNGCSFKKGNYFWVVDFTDCTYKYLGTSFFYGEFVFKLIALSKKGNIACLFYNPVFMKKS